MRRRRIATGVAAAAVILSIGTTARPAGVFEDAAAEAGFVLRAHRGAALARLVATDGPAGRASVVTMAAVFAPAPWILVSLEQPFATLRAADGTDADGFGDLRLRARADLRRRRGSRWVALVNVGTGSGTSALFPLASQALEVGLGTAWVDTTAAFHWWAGAEGVLVRRAPVGLPDERRHVDFVRAFAGIRFALRQARIGGGFERLAFDGGRWRELWFVTAEFDVTAEVALDVTGQLEAGDDAVRVTDRSLRVGMRVAFPPAEHEGRAERPDAR